MRKSASGWKRHLPAVANTAEIFTTVIKPVTALISECPLLTQTIMGLGVGLVALKVSAMAGGYAATVLSDGWNIAKGVFNFLRPSVIAANAALVRQKVVALGSAVASRAVAMGSKLAAAGQWVLNAALTANPIGLVVVGLTALGAGMVYLYNTCEPVRAVFDSVFSWLGDKFSWVTDKIAAIGGALKTVGKWVGLVDEEEPTASDAQTANKTKAATATPPIQAVAKPETTATWYNPLSWWGGEEQPEATATPPIQAVAKPETTATWYNPLSWLGGEEQPKTSVAQTARQTVASTKTEAPAVGTQTATPTKTVAEATQTVAATNRNAGIAPTSSTVPPIPQAPAMQPPTGGAGGGVNVSMNFTLNGVPDGEFGSMVISAIKKRQGEFQSMISAIVGEQRRLAYGSV